MYQYLLFDADNTLFDFTRASEVAFGETMLHFDIVQNEETYPIYLKINKGCWQQLERGEITPQEIKSLRYKLFMEAIGKKGNPLEMNDFYLHRLAEKNFMLDGAEEMLRELRGEGYSLSIITNGLKIVQRPRIERAGLTHIFDAITVSEEIGIAKPDPRFFADTFGQLGNPEAENVLVIGDNLLSDIQGGINVGADTVWFNPHGKSGSTNISPTVEVQDFADLKSFIYRNK